MTWLLVAAVVIGVVSAGVGTWQAVESRKRQEEEAEMVEDEKKKEAADARESALFAEQQHRRRVALLLGKQSSITAAAGVSPLSGSALSAEIDLAEQGELEALNLRRGGKLEAQGREFEARIAKFRADTARSAVPFEIAGGVLSASASVTSAYSSYQYRSQASQWRQSQGYQG